MGKLKDWILAFLAFVASPYMVIFDIIFNKGRDTLKRETITPYTIDGDFMFLVGVLSGVIQLVILLLFLFL